MSGQLMSEQVTTQEQWKPIPGYETFYSASSIGRIRRDRGGRGTRSIGHILKQRADKQTGYLRLHLVTNGIDIVRTVHSLVAAAFLGPCPIGLCVNHKDGNKVNNTPTNLEYLTLADNNKHAAANGLTYRPTHCIAGHEFTEENTYNRYDRGRARECKICSRRRKREYKVRQKGLAGCSSSGGRKRVRLVAGVLVTD